MAKNDKTTPKNETAEIAETLKKLRVQSTLFSIRTENEVFNQINSIADKLGISRNKVINQILKKEVPKLYNLIIN